MHVKNQHYVPEFLLKHFADEKRHIWCYDKQWKRIERKGVGGVAFEQYFYDSSPGIKEGSLEYVYQRAETDTAPIIQKIISQNDLGAITLEEKIALALFTVMQLNRTKTALKETETFSRYFINSIKEFVELQEVQSDLKHLPARDLWQLTLGNAPAFAEILLRKVWCLANCDGEFYTSDHPVVRSNYKNRSISQVRGVLGLNSDGVEIYFPLTPSLLLCILCEKCYAYLNGSVVKYQEENIEYVNHLQVQQSEKFVFASNNDFKLVKDMIKKGEV